MTGFTVSGPGPSTCGSIRYGIFVKDDANANIHHNTIADIRDEPVSGCQTGVGILVGRNSVGTSGTATIKHNTIVDYQKGGVAQSPTIENRNQKRVTDIIVEVGVITETVPLYHYS